MVFSLIAQLEKDKKWDQIVKGKVKEFFKPRLVGMNGPNIKLGIIKFPFITPKDNNMQYDWEY